MFACRCIRPNTTWITNHGSIICLQLCKDLKEIFIDITSDEELLTRIMKESDLLESTSEAIRMIKQGAVRVNDEKVSDTKFCLQKGTKYLVQVGKKRAANITLN